MKKFYFWSLIALAALSMTSCSQDETLEARPQENAIEFSTYLGRDIETRGTVLSDANLANMGVFASYTGQSAWKDDIRSFNFMFNQKVDYDGANWTYSPIKYWPTTKNDKISFWAYAPYVSSPVKAISIVSTNASVGVPQIKYTLTADNLAEAEDFTAEVLMDEVQAGDGISIDSKDRKVNFLLKHELSRIAIKAKLDRDAFTSGENENQTQVNIKKIEFGGTKFASEAIYSFGDADNERGTWDLGTVGSNTLDITSLLDASNTSLGGYAVSGVRVPTTTEVVLFGADKYLFHIPTNGTTGTVAAGNVKLTVEYDIVTIDNKLSAGYSVTPAKKEIDLPASLLAQGKAYNIVLTFGLNEIKLSATVEAWEEISASSDHNVDWPKVDK